MSRHTSWVQRSCQRVDDATGHPSASETATARATATAAGWSAARTVTVLMIWLAVCALTMLAALADAACPAATANSAGLGWSPPSLPTAMATSQRPGAVVLHGTASGRAYCTYPAR